jgi:hypothetical protein
MTENHLSAIRSRTQYRHAHIFVFIESNYSVIEAGRVSDIMSQHRFAPLSVEKQCTAKNQSRIGVLTGANEKKVYAEDLQMVLSREQLQYPVETEFISQQPEPAKEELLKQLRMYRRETKASNHEDEAFALIKETYSGKGGGRKDDLCMALQIALYHGQIKRISNEYEGMALMYGWRC